MSPSFQEAFLAFQCQTRPLTSTEAQKSGISGSVSLYGRKLSQGLPEAHEVQQWKNANCTSKDQQEPAQTYQQLLAAVPVPGFEQKLADCKRSALTSNEGSPLQCELREDGPFATLSIDTRNANQTILTQLVGKNIRCSGPSLPMSFLKRVDLTCVRDGQGSTFARAELTAEAANGAQCITSLEPRQKIVRKIESTELMSGRISADLIEFAPRAGIRIPQGGSLQLDVATLRAADTEGGEATLDGRGQEGTKGVGCGAGKAGGSGAQITINAVSIEGNIQCLVRGGAGGPAGSEGCEPGSPPPEPAAKGEDGFCHVQLKQ
ncbi:hypothetical protein F0U62_49775 [Cystobacter fuscus]|uniref:hypothetical protein n=1 Tax=Cystobacter fuscus TaxID=43 RepID=UPI002B2F5B48|nr:hypothetical protein F0U62_49775 [Cystobacter fuscus]